jgi:N6-L-threonylcarbamoyladenine synthase
MITLGIETSCDETALCLLETNSNQYRVLGHIIHSQIESHREYGGVFPMVAKREHSKKLIPLMEELIKDIDSTTSISADTETIRKILEEKEPELYKQFITSSLMKSKISIDRIAVTAGPGLEPALWVGVNFARALGTIWNVPIVPVNHMEGHVVGSLLPTSEHLEDFHQLKDIPTPAIALLISGGHTELIEVSEIGKYKKVGSTKDDAVGEAFDKTARMLGLPYPGGPEISKYADKARKENLERKVTLPRPMIHSHSLDFSFSGLKTAVLYSLRDGGAVDDTVRAIYSRELEEAIGDVLVKKTRDAIESVGAMSLIVGGGVIANTYIRSRLENLAKECGIDIHLPPKGVSGDNALMIALAGSMKSPPYGGDTRAIGNWSL